MLIDRPGVPATTWGCSRANIDAVLDDAAPSPAEGQCSVDLYAAINGTFSPNTPLSVFDNENAAGTWTLTSADLSGDYAGQLDGWGLIIACADVNEVNVVEPEPVSQGLMGMPYGTAQFGPVYAPVDIKKYFYLPSGSVDASNLLGCNAWPAGTFTGMAAVIKRGTCAFVTKVKNAQDAGAAAVVVCNAESGGDELMNMGGADSTIIIPSVFIGNTNGNGLVSWYGTNGPSSRLQISYAGYPPTVTISQATAITNTAATLNAGVNANGPDTVVSFQYGTDITYGTTVAALPGTVSGGSPTAVSAGISGLAPDTLYHYRAVATSFYATTYGPDTMFMTNGTYSSTDAFPVAIPDNTPAGVTSTLVIPADACTSIMDLNVAVQATHTWVGDLIFTLTHNETGTSAVIIDRPGTVGGGFGCTLNDINATLDDEAASPVEEQCSGTPAISGTFRPNNPLSVFDGENAAGTWTLRAVDAFNGDTGHITGWGLNPACGNRLDVAVNTGSGSGTVTSTPAGISCGSTCTAVFPRYAYVSLDAAPSADSYLSGWTGVCAGYGAQCPVTMSVQRSTTAVFEAVADFTYTMDPVSGNAPVTVSFAGSAAPGTTAWSWDFGDGQYSSVQNPVHNFSTASVWPVTLTVTKDGSPFSITKNVTTNACGDTYPQGILGTGYFPTVQAAYNSALSGDAILIQAKDIDIAGTLTLNRPVLVTLEGGYNCGFSSNLFFTTLLNSAVVISGDAVTFENIAIH
ncbi:MAG: proprotein convertase P-domain-containing protein [Nitrospirae bacterium]|nr:proprotein convertase P-domain-containing protein [Nitrospirota bacterium]